MAGRPPKYETTEELEKAIEGYFEGRKPEMILDSGGEPLFDRKGNPIFKLNPPSITGLAIHLGFVSRQSMYDYEQKPEFSDTIKKARLRCENYAEEALMAGECAPAAGIFVLKNFGWSDKQEIEHGGKVSTEFSIIGVDVERNTDS